MMVSGAGSAPARSRMARSLADCTVKLPEICPEPPRIGSRITGAEITLLSSTMANGLPTLACVASANLRAPDELKRKLTIGSLVRWSKPGWASIRSAPETSTRFSIRYFCAGLLAVEDFRIPADARPAACSGVIDRSTMRKSSFAVLPRISFSRDGSCRPGTCTRMRSMPSRWMVGSTRPSSLTRRSMIWID